MGTGVGDKHKRGRNTEIFKNQRIKYANKNDESVTIWIRITAN